MQRLFCQIICNSNAEDLDNSLYWKAPEYTWLPSFVPNCEYENQDYGIYQILFFSVKPARTFLLHANFLFLPVIKLYSLLAIKRTFLFSEMQWILDKVTRMGTKTLAEAAAVWPPQLTYCPVPHGIGNLLSGSQQLQSSLFLRSLLNLINDFNGYLLMSTWLIHRTGPEDQDEKNLIYSYWSLPEKIFLFFQSQAGTQIEGKDEFHAWSSLR